MLKRTRKYTTNPIAFSKFSCSRVSAFSILRNECRASSTEQTAPILMGLEVTHSLAQHGVRDRDQRCDDHSGECGQSRDHEFEATRSRKPHDRYDTNEKERHEERKGVHSEDWKVMIVYHVSLLCCITHHHRTVLCLGRLRTLRHPRQQSSATLL